MTNVLINLQIQILTYMCVGFILYKVKMINPDAQNFLSSMTLEVLLPLNVFCSFLSNISMDLLQSLVIVLLVAIVIEAALFCFTKVKLPNFTAQQSCVSNYGILVSNGGMIGTPVIEGLFGGAGVMFCNVFLIPTRVMAYTAGESIFNPQARKSLRRIIVNFLQNKIIIAMTLSFLLSAFRIALPIPFFTALKQIGQCLSPISLILVGSMLAEKIELNGSLIVKVAVVSGLRLLAIPCVVLAFCYFLHLDFQTTSIITLLMGMPVGSTCAIFAKKYRGDTTFASMCVFATTLLSTVSLVGLMALIEHLF